MEKVGTITKKMNKENIAVNVVDQIISCTELLSPDFARNDRTPTWDGFIYAYKNADRRKDQMYGRAPVQIKGTTNNPQNSKGVYYRVSYSDMENFREDGGALFFIVYIKSVEEQEVFYASLLPFVLNDLLKKHYGKNHSYLDSRLCQETLKTLKTW